MAAATSEFGLEYASPRSGRQSTQAIARTATPPTPDLVAVMAELGASRQANEWQAAQLREQSETIGRLRSDLESNASEVIGLKIREHQLMSDVARQMAEVQSLRAELALARSNVHTSTPPQIETGWQSEQDAAVEPMLGISGRWCVVTTAVAVIAALGAWALSAGFRW